MEQMTADARSSRLHPTLSRCLGYWPGFALSALVAAAAMFVSTTHGGPPFLYALLIGIAFHHLSHDAHSKPGIEACARNVLRLGVGLLGARITASQIAELGWTTALLTFAGVVTTIACGYFLGRRLGLTASQGVLSGGAVGICGASAALAISAVLPRDKDSDRFTLMVVVSVTVMSTIAMVVYPLLARFLHLSPHLAGVFLGGSIHDVAQVVGAGYTLGQEAGDTATIVKLFRVAMLAVVVVVVAAIFKKERERVAVQAAQGGRVARPPVVPWFLWVFVALVVLNSTALIPTDASKAMGLLSQYCLIVAIAALGLKTSFKQLAKTGWRPMVLIVVETAWIATGVLVGAIALGL